jgi:hypothetical protein
MCAESDAIIRSTIYVPRQGSPGLVFLSSPQWLLLSRPKEDETGGVSKVDSKMSGIAYQLYEEQTILILSRVMHPFRSGSSKENCPLR